jgi:hypothetical protein
MKQLLSAVLVAGVLVAASAAALADANVSLADFARLHQVEITFHKAASTQDVDLMMSLFAKDATLTYAGKTYAGADQIRTFFSTVAKPFQPGNHWAAYTPAYRIRLGVDGDHATLYFECLYVDMATGTIMAHTNSDDTLIRSGDHFLIQTMKADKVAGY